MATGIANNRLGEMGTGGQVADPILLRVNGTIDERNRAIRTAVAWVADVVSMSFGGDCNSSCRVDDRDDNPFDDAVNGGSKVVFVAAAGNGRPPTILGPPPSPAPSPVGYDVGDPSFVHPCTEDHVICVGALNPGANTKIQYSNFGGQVLLFAPTNIPVMSLAADLEAAIIAILPADSTGSSPPASDCRLPGTLGKARRLNKSFVTQASSLSGHAGILPACFQML